MARVLVVILHYKEYRQDIDSLLHIMFSPVESWSRDVLKYSAKNEFEDLSFFLVVTDCRTIVFQERDVANCQLTCIHLPKG